ncbi:MULTISPECIES: fibronectin type III domain-containing protein [Xanthobacter]|uniref:Fibronectin type III domain-containing protein n=1 Tax=Xanthobacter aminoxidans TaxID=186280 RepID=A0ABW6ZMA4_9HYPH|nr:fibronectin type III domain-containing protein [Xanthobacter sp. 91]
MRILHATSIALVSAFTPWLAGSAWAQSCPAAWNSSSVYTAGAQASENGIIYRANWWTQNQDPATNNGGSGTGQPWTQSGSCSSCTAVPPVPKGLAASGTTGNATTLTWTPVTVANCTISGYQIYMNGTLTTTSSGASVTVSGLTPLTSYSFAIAAVDSVGASAKSAPVTVTTLSGPPPSTASTGTINFHLLLGVGTAQDSLTLTGGNYDDLIMSNIVAGVLLGHLIDEGFPGIQYNKDYLYGSIFAQLLQENIATQYYKSSSDLIDPNANQQAVMGVGQGGPYQINNYAADMVSGSYQPKGHSLINYVAIQKNIGFTMANAATQYTKATPASFNNKYYGPALVAYFHYNDLVALNVTGKGAGGWTTPWEPAFDTALKNFTTLPNSFLDVILNVAYNQGFYGPLVSRYSNLGATATAATVTSVNSYSSAWGSSDTYVQYPYQVHYYLDQLYNNPVPTTSPTLKTTPTNSVVFNISALANVFSRVAQTLSYSNGTNPAQFYTAAQANAAFSSALTKLKVASSAKLDLSKATARATIFSVIDAALANLEAASGMKFISTTDKQL